MSIQRVLRIFGCENLRFSLHEEDKENLIDLAPFKFPFSKMSKTRSSEEKDREKDKETGDSETEKETIATTENEEGNGKEATKDGNKERNMNDDNDTEDNARGEDAQLPVNQLQLATEPESNLKPSVFASNSFMPRNEPAIPSSAPPSYQHVIEQTRLEYAAEAQKHEEEKISAREASAQENRKKAPKILHKSSKQFYRAMAKQWGITCKMSDHCRCLDCQSRYFDCEYDTNQQTDGGLGAGAPMFISDVMQGSACILL
ncbi:uncharacterized protein LOC143347759 isoform X1 [Colletes latitarsis]|uniref:uncharacterized protein LOC143347759 isoform X1 n=2 Tax=Colletes latitarsis TaxID=2605962 RepID=UPI004034F91F